MQAKQVFFKEHTNPERFWIGQLYGPPAAKIIFRFMLITKLTRVTYLNAQSFKAGVTFGLMNRKALLERICIPCNVFIIKII